MHFLGVTILEHFSEKGKYPHWRPSKNKLFDEYFDKVRDARVHWFNCGWLSCQYRTLISQIAILLVSLTSHDRCCCRDNTVWSNSFKRTNYSSEFFVSSQIQIFYVFYSYRNVSHINWCLFLMRNSAVVEVGLWSHHLYPS